MQKKNCNATEKKRWHLYNPPTGVVIIEASPILTTYWVDKIEVRQFLDTGFLP